MIQITSLCDNVNNSKKFWSIEGNSILINIDGSLFLFDTGRSANILLNNLSCINVKINNLSAIILSHAHMGHVGAMKELQLVSAMPIYFGKGFEVPKYKWKNGKYTPVRNEELAYDLYRSYASCIAVDRFFEVVKSKLYLFKADYTHTQSLEKKHTIYFQNNYIQDRFDEELHLCIKSSNGLILLSGCAHCGVESMIQTAINTFNDNRIYAVLGGTHIFDDKQKTDNYIKIMREYNVSFTAPSHCTGIFSRTNIAEALSNQFISLTTGETIFLED